MFSICISLKIRRFFGSRVWEQRLLLRWWMEKEWGECCVFPSVHQHCCLGDRKDVWPVKNPGAILSPVVLFCASSCLQCLLAPAHPGGPGKSAIKRLWWWFSVLEQVEEENRGEPADPGSLGKIAIK